MHTADSRPTQVSRAARWSEGFESPTVRATHSGCTLCRSCQHRAVALGLGGRGLMISMPPAAWCGFSSQVGGSQRLAASQPQSIAATDRGAIERGNGERVDPHIAAQAGGPSIGFG